ncbi:hypothetical protein CR513_03349, partial [Mucuna pruriens]
MADFQLRFADTKALTTAHQLLLLLWPTCFQLLPSYLRSFSGTISSSCTHSINNISDNNIFCCIFKPSLPSRLSWKSSPSLTSIWDPI